MRKSLLVVPCMAAMVTSCTGTPSLGSVGSAVPATGPRSAAASLPLRNRSLPSQLLFVPLENGAIDIYPLKHAEKKGPVAQITGLTAFQDGMVVDAGGNLFVANNGSFGNDDYVMEFAPPYDSPPTILNTVWMSQTFYPIGVAVDAAGNLYVSNCGDYCFESPAVFVYPPGATSPTNAITSSQFNSLAGLALDVHGNLYVVGWNDQTFAVDVFEMPAGSSKFRPLHLHGLVTGNGGNGVTFDAAGDVYVSAISSGSNYVLEYKPGKRNAFFIIDSLPFLDEPTQLQVGPDGNLYVPVSCGVPPCPYVYGFKPRAKKAFEAIGSAPSTNYTFSVGVAPNPALQGSR